MLMFLWFPSSLLALIRVKFFPNNVSPVREIDSMIDIEGVRVHTGFLTA
jgi:hypothetical protein